MIFNKKEIVLKNGQVCLLRSPEPCDAVPMIDYIKTCSGETEFLLSYPEEITFTPEQEESFLNGIIVSDNAMMIVAFVGGEIAGNCQISFNGRLKTSHRASVAIALKQKYWGNGIGTALFSELTAAAKERGVVQMELDFIEGNSRARGLYEKSGFRICGVKPNAIRLKDGRLVNEYSMIKEI